MKKQRLVVFICCVVILGVFWGLCSSLLDTHRQKACLSPHFRRVLIDQHGFLETIDGESYLTDNSQVIEDAMSELLKRDPHFERYLYGNHELDVVSFLPDKSYAIKVGNYYYFPYDANGKRIRWSDEKSREHIMLIDARPLRNGNILMLYAGSGGARSEKKLSVVQAELKNQYTPCSTNDSLQEIEAPNQFKR